MPLEKQLRIMDTGAVVVPRLEIARTGRQRAVGLIGRAALAPDAGLWLHPCNGIHTFGVRFSIDVLFLDGQGHVLRLVHDLAPCRVRGPMWKARTVVELPAGALRRLNLKPGMQIEVISETDLL